MNQKRLLTILGLIFLLLYLISALIWIFNFQTDIKTQNTQQLMLM